MALISNFGNTLKALKIIDLKSTILLYLMSKHTNTTRNTWYLFLLIIDGKFQAGEFHPLPILVRWTLGVVVEDDGEFLGAAGLVEQVHSELLALAP